MKFGIGQPVTRKEDPRFLTGRARYVADIDLARREHIERAFAFFGSPGHFRIRVFRREEGSFRRGEITDSY